MPATTSNADVIARGTSNAAFAQLTCSAATTRSGTTATATVTNTTLAVNDWVLIQGHDLEEYNGIFQVASLISTTGITYVIKQDPGASSGTTTTMTVDKVTRGTPVDMTAAYSGRIDGFIQNGNGAPSVAAQVWFGVARTSAAADYQWKPIASGDITARSLSPFGVALVPGAFCNIAVCRNTTNAVDCAAIATQVTA